MTAPTQAWHTAMTIALMCQARGDLMLDENGDLHYRNIWDENYTKELPWAQHRLDEKLATVSDNGWTVTRNGARFILDRCAPVNARDIRKLKYVAAQPFNTASTF